MGNMVEIVYTWPDGREEVRYRRTQGTYEAMRLMKEVDDMRARLGATECPYSYRIADSTSAGTT